MILSFKKKFPWGADTNFEQKILTGVKKHSIREDKKGRWKPGVKVHADTGVRTKNQKRIMEGVCRSVQAIAIKRNTRGVVCVFIDGLPRYVSSDTWISELEFIGQLSKNDGFDSVEDFFKWFSSDFQGRIIHWTDLRY